MRRDWERPYRPGLVWQCIWWFDMVFAVVVFILGALAITAGLIAPDGALATTGLIFVTFAIITEVGAWRLIHLGVWTYTDSVEIRAFARRSRRFSWEVVDHFEVRRGTGVVPGVRPALQVSLVTSSGGAVLAPGLWHRSPFTWGGVGPVRIVDELNRRLSSHAR